MLAKHNRPPELHTSRHRSAPAGLAALPNERALELSYGTKNLQDKFPNCR